jgi:hypothetical protein
LPASFLSSSFNPSMPFRTSLPPITNPLGS